MLPRAELKAGAYYKGQCRNATVARWTGDRFVHWRAKFGRRFLEEIFHPDDDNIYDVFTPYYELTEVVEEIPYENTRV